MEPQTFKHKEPLVENNKVKRCQYCNKPFYIYFREDGSGESDTQWEDKYHTECMRKMGKNPKTLHEINEERK